MPNELSQSTARCKTRCKAVCTGWAEDGTKRCRACRKHHNELLRACRLKNPENRKAADRQAQLSYKLRNPAKVRLANRAHAAKYRVSTAPKAVAYRERSRKANRRASAKWAARNRDQKRLIAKFGHLLKRGEIIKPSRCADCRKRKSPLVGWNIHEGDNGTPSCDCFVCWGCFWQRKRGE